MASPPQLVDALCDPSRPVFTFGSCPPREGTTDEQARESAMKFAESAWKLACDGFIVYDIQDEAGRTTVKRPFPFRPTIDPSGFGQLLSECSGKQCVIYKSVGEPSVAAFDKWLNACEKGHGHNALNLVGAATSKRDIPGPTLGDAASRVLSRAASGSKMAFGCVTIAERHMSKGTEHLNIVRKMDLGAQWFISQAVYDPDATIALLNDYGDLCKKQRRRPVKVLLTFAPCGRRKTMTFVKWLGVAVPSHVEAAILEGAPELVDLGPDATKEQKRAHLKEIQAASRVSVKACVALLDESLGRILEATHASGVPIGINVESVSGYAEECDASYDLFFVLQKRLLEHTHRRRWAVRWADLRPLAAQQKAAEAQAVELEDGGAAAGESGALLSMVTVPAVQLTFAASAGAVIAHLLLKLRERKP